MPEHTLASLEAENRRLREIVAALRRENTTLVLQVSELARGAVPPPLTLNEAASRRISGVGALQRLCVN